MNQCDYVSYRKMTKVVAKSKYCLTSVWSILRNSLFFQDWLAGWASLVRYLSGCIYQSGGWVNIFGLLMHQHLYGFDELNFKSFSDHFAILFIDDLIVYSNSKPRDDPKYPTHDSIWQQWFCS
jgi:hypothetical protein